MADGRKTLPRPRSTVRALVLLALVPAVAASAFIGYRRVQSWRSAEALFRPLREAPYRHLDARLTYARADLHRPLGARRDGADPPVLVPYQHLWQLERAGEAQAVVAAHLQLGQPAQALARLQSLPPTADVESDRAAVLLLDPRTQEEALTAADRALEQSPQHPQAHWNRALILESLGLPLAAAASFHAVAALNEPGWSEEARARADRAASAWQLKVASAAAADRAVEPLRHGDLPDAATLDRYPERVRATFLSALESAPPAQLDRLRAVARAIDDQQHTTSLEKLAADPARVRRMKQLYGARSVGNAEEYLRLAQQIADPLLQIRAWTFLGLALAKDREADRALAVHQQGLDHCARERRFPEACLTLKVQLAKFHGERRHLQAARRWALEVREQSELAGLPALRVKATLRLQAIEDFRKRFGLERAYAEELSLQDLDCPLRQYGREYLAKIAVARQQDLEARAQLAAVQTCPGARVRFSTIGTEALVELTRDPIEGWQAGWSWLQEVLAVQLQPGAGLGVIERLAHRMFQARSLVLRDPARARDLLARLADEARTRAEGDEVAQMIRIQAVSALVTEAAGRGDFARALDVLEREQTDGAGRRCLAVAAADSRRRIYVVRGRDGQTSGVYRPAVPYDFAAPAPETFPAELVGRLSGCEDVGVLATEPIVGAPGLLPPELAWGYLRGHQPAPPLGGTVRRLIVRDVRTPPELGLPAVGRGPATAGAPDEVFTVLTEAAATPTEVTRQLDQADEIELHVHGILDREIADEAALALAPDADGGSSFLTSGQVQKMRLPRRPGVVLGACHGARSAGYGAFEWNLALSFMRAGARWVIASPQPVDDAEAGAFFQEIWQRIRAGAPAPVALRDTRQSSRWHSSHPGWTQQVIAFY